MRYDKKKIVLDAFKYNNCVFELLVNENDDEVICIIIKQLFHQNRTPQFNVDKKIS